METYVDAAAEAESVQVGDSKVRRAVAEPEVSSRLQWRRAAVRELKQSSKKQVKIDA